MDRHGPPAPSASRGPITQREELPQEAARLQIRLLVVEGDSAWRRNLRHTLEASGQARIAAEASSASQACSLLPIAPVDLILLGLATPTPDEVADALKLREDSHGTPLVAVCPTTDDTHLLMAITLGASACISRDIPPEFLISTLTRVWRGEHPIQYDLLSHAGTAAALLRRLREHPIAPPTPPTPSPLSPRENIILQHVAQGYSNKEIGSALNVTEQTVKNHLSAILRKVNARDRAHAAVMAILNHWITLP